MGLLTFKGGIHPFDGKELSKEQPIEVYLPKGTMAYPLSQHIGAPATAIVKKGDVVCIIEAMKLMNEIAAEEEGQIVEVCVQNGQIVEYGQTLCKLS